MPFVQVGDTDIHYVTKGRGPPLVFVHGFGGCAQGWYQQIEADAYNDVVRSFLSTVVA